MLGNRIGWAISAVMWAVAIGALWLFYRTSTEFSPPGKIGQNVARWTLEVPIPPRSVATWMTEQGKDAIELYRKASEGYILHESDYEKLLNTRQSEDQDNLDLTAPFMKSVMEQVGYLVMASKLAKGGVFADRPQELITYDPDRPTLKAYSGIMKGCLCVANKYLRMKQGAKAMEVYQGVFSLGLKLHEERLVRAEWQMGRELMAVAILMARIEPDAAKKEKLQEFDKQWATWYVDRMQDVDVALRSTQPWAERPPAGDMAALARDSKELMWRVEAILALGRCKYHGVTMGDQLGAKRLVTDLATDQDRAISIAGTLARELTREQFRLLRAE